MRKDRRRKVGPASGATAEAPSPPRPPRRRRASPRRQVPDGGTFEMAGREFAPGTTTRFELPIAPLPSQAELSMPIVVVRGVRPGPRLFVTSGIHGDELNGVASLTLVQGDVRAEDLAGTLVMLPFVNHLGLIHQSRYFPDRRDLNRSFPGSKRGTLAARTAYFLMKEVAGRCTHGIDLHTAAVHRDNLPQVRADLSHPLTRRLARAFGAPVMIHSRLRDGSFREAAASHRVPMLLFEGGEALRAGRPAIRCAHEGVLRVMEAIGMRPSGLPRAKKPFESWATTWVRSPRSGFAFLDVDLGDRVRKGQTIGAVVMGRGSAYGEFRTRVRAPCHGIVIGIARNPLVLEGDAFVHIAERGRSASVAADENALRDTE